MEVLLATYLEIGMNLFMQANLHYQNACGEWVKRIEFLSLFVCVSLYFKIVYHSNLGSMPEDHSRYYGFTRFAIELNELTPGLKEKIAVTDTR